MLQRLFRFWKRNRQYFVDLKDTVAQDNLRILMRSAVIFEGFLVAYGLWGHWRFRNIHLSKYYVLFLAVNCLLIAYAVFVSRRESEHRFSMVQAGCAALVAEIMAFVICISVFPFPDRSAVFYPVAYMLLLMLFQFRILRTQLMFTAAMVCFLFAAWRVKRPEIFQYDKAMAVTTWLVGFVLLYMITDLNLRSGEARLKLERESRTDFLTGLPNRREMEEVFHRVYRRCARIGVPVAAVMLDVDHFKRFNDLYGHTAGDRCLEEIGGRLAAFVEETGYFAARYGGEEFAVIFSGCGEERAAAYARTLMERLCFQTEEGNTVTVSIGVAVELPGLDGAPEALLRRADEALYRAKEGGRNRFVLDAAPTTIS